MSIESVGAYSPDIVYGQFTMPFDEKPVHINAHTDLEQENDEEEFVSKTKFYNNNADMAVSIDDIRNMKGLELDANIAPKMFEQNTEFPPKGLVASFQSSNFNNGNGIVYEALKNGYTGQAAIKIANAHNAYENSMNSIKDNPIDYLQKVVYTTS